MTFINYGEITVAQKLLVDPLAVAGSDAFVGGFRYNVTNNALRVADGTIPVVFHGGLGFTADGRLCVQSGAMPITSYVNGLAMNTTGQVLVDSASPPVWSAHGWPISALSKLCVEGVVIATAQAHFAGAGSITSPKVWAPTTQFALEAQVKYTGAMGGAWRAIMCTNPSQPQISLAYNTAGAGAFELRVFDQTNGLLTTVSSLPPALNVNPLWVRVIAAPGNILFYSSPDRAVWTAMGGTGGTAFTGLASGGSLNIGGSDAYFNFPAWVGDIGRVQGWNDTGETVPGFDCDPSKWVSGTTFVSGGDTYTLNGGVTIS